MGEVLCGAWRTLPMISTKQRGCLIRCINRDEMLNLFTPVLFLRRNHPRLLCQRSSLSTSNKLRGVSHVLPFLPFIVCMIAKAKKITPLGTFRSATWSRFSPYFSANIVVATRPFSEAFLCVVSPSSALPIYEEAKNAEM